MTNRSTGQREQSYDILLVDAHPDQIDPFIESFRSTELTNEVHVVSDGEEALDFVHQREDYTDAPRPDLIMLDFHINGETGEEVLAELKQEPELGRIPVIVFTSDATAEDIVKSYDLQANAHLQRPTSEEEFEETATAIEDFWLKLAQIPPK